MIKDYSFVGTHGEINNREEILSGLRTSNIKFESFKTEQEQWRLFGDTAIVIGIAIGKGHNIEGEFRGKNRFTGVYIKNDGKWKLVNWQTTPVKQEKL